ncbi:hypothetical protein [Paenibacillus amylolyticus]|uniref:hypothetical protein n=1 Tax=Paenibacillus amylolyticus TaxID=1451 RepID=UPI00201D301C|nr:hypothetical protein [Paenibacillus amylolyticus]MCL6663512.1 hypothetical protein [Paenibacillus amylolyticus]
MGKLTLSMLLEDYKQYREQKNNTEDKTKATHIETCRQKLSDIMDVMGINSILFRDPDDKRSFQFSEEDKNLVFELIDRFSSPDFVLMRRGKYLEVPVNSLRFYLKSFVTLLEHLQIDPEVIGKQKEQMIQRTRYTLAVELQNIKQIMEGIQKDINQITEEASESNITGYLDSITLMRDLGIQLHSLRERNQTVFCLMVSERGHEGAFKDIETLKQYPMEEKERIKKSAKLISVLRNNKEFMDLINKSRELEGDIIYSKKKRYAYLKARKEMDIISFEAQIQEFGALIPSSNLEDDSKMSRISSEDVLSNAIKAYKNIRILLREASDPDEFPFAAVILDMIAERFDNEANNRNRGDESMEILAIYNIVTATYLELDWEDLVKDAYDAYSELSEQDRTEFDRLINEAVIECKDLFLSFPEMYQTDLDLDIRNESQDEIIKKIEDKFESFL